MHEHAKFKSLQRSEKEDWPLIISEFGRYAKALPDRVITHLKLLEGDFGGFPVDRLTHSLQTATRALRDDRDNEYVVCALLHDIGVPWEPTITLILPPQFLNLLSAKPIFG